MIPEIITLSDSTRDALSAAIIDFRRAHPPIPNHLPTTEKIQLAMLVEGVLQKDPQGFALLQAIERLKDGTGEPALIIRNLPVDERINLNIMDGESQYGTWWCWDMLDGMCYMMGHLLSCKLSFAHVSDNSEGSNGFPNLHHDHSDYAGVFCAAQGDPGRPTVCFTADELLTAMAERKAEKNSIKLCPGKLESR